jgi:hypothetical protein
MNETTTELFVQYREYVAKCEKNGVYPLYSYNTWILCRSQF